MNRFLFRELDKEFDLSVVDVPRTDPRRLLRAALNFHPSRARWRKRFADAQMQYWVSPECFRHRTALARDALRQCSGYDLVLQIGGMFNGVAGLDCPRVGFASWNGALSEQRWPEWVPFRTNRDRQEFFALERQYYEELDQIFCTNRNVMRSFSEDYGLPVSKLTYIGYGINFDVLPDVSKTYDSNVALFVGYDFQRKGGPTVVEAFKRVHEEIPSARLRIIGPGHLDSKYLVDGVEYLAPIRDRTLMQEHFRQADFFVMPSFCEPFGLVFLEAMAFKNACIGANNDAMPEIIDHGRTGYRINAGDVDHLAYLMRQMFRDRDLRKTLGQAAYRDVRNRFTWERCGERTRHALMSAHGS